jgi:hypothetical protein
MEAASLVAGFPYAEPTGLVSWSFFLLMALSVSFLAFPGVLVGVLSSAGWVSPLLSLEPGVGWQ